MKNRKLKSISYKLIMSFLVVIVILILLIWILQAIMLKTSYQWFREKQIKSAITELREYISNNIEDEKLEELSIKNDCIIYIYDMNMNNIYTSQSANSQPRGVLNEINKAMQEVASQTVDKNVTLTKAEIEYNIYGENINNHYVIILSELAPVEATTEVIINQLKIISIFSIIISIIIAIFISKKIAKPIRETSEKAKELSSGNFEVEFNHYESIEMKELSDTLNKATQELKEKEKIKKELISNVSHDLKTPLSIIKGYCEMIQDITGDDKQKRDEQLQKIQKETNNLTLMINDMLDLSKLDNKDVLQIEKFEISNLIEETLSRVSSILEKEQIKIIYHPYKCFVEGDRAKIGQVLYNLIVNAINFAGDDNSIFINQVDIGNAIRIEILDHGIGISEKDLPYIFDRYYKTNDKYRKNGVSTGLGLAIVKSILEKHHFKYGVESKKGEGTKFWFEIKKYHIDIT